MGFRSAGLWVDHGFINPNGKLFAVSALSDCDFRGWKGLRCDRSDQNGSVPFDDRPVHLSAYAAVWACE